MARGALIKTPSPRPRERRAATWIAWSLAGLSLAMFVAGLALYVAARSAQLPSSWGTGGIAAQLIFTPFLAFSVVGALIVSRHPRNLVGWICVADGFIWMLAILTGPYTLYGLANPGTVPFPVAVSALTTWLWVPAVGLLGIYLILLFPDGRLPSRRWRYLAWFAGAVIVLASAGNVVIPGPLEGLPGTRNPFGLEGYQWAENVGVAVIALLPLCILASAASLILRFRRSGHETRQQIKWLASAATLVGLMYLGTVAATLLFAPGSMDSGSPQPSWLSLLQNVVLMSYAVVPGAVGIAVLRYRLYDIDLVINRALVYGVLTACVVGLYVLVVGGLGALLQAQGNLLVSILAAGLVAVLFQPLRDRLQRGVDRLMYGERDDPYAVLSRLSRRLEGTLAPEAVLPAIVENVTEALRLPHVAVWLTDEDAVRLGAAHSRAPVETLVRDAAAVEILRHTPDGLRPQELGTPSQLWAVLERSGVEFVLPLDAPWRAGWSPVHGRSQPWRGLLISRPASSARPGGPGRHRGTLGPAHARAEIQPQRVAPLARGARGGPGGGAPPRPARPARRSRSNPGKHAPPARSLPGRRPGDRSLPGR